MENSQNNMKGKCVIHYTALRTALRIHRNNRITSNISIYWRKCNCETSQNNFYPKITSFFFRKQWVVFTCVYNVTRCLTEMLLKLFALIHVPDFGFCIWKVISNNPTKIFFGCSSCCHELEPVPKVINFLRELWNLVCEFLLILKDVQCKKSYRKT